MAGLAARTRLQAEENAGFPTPAGGAPGAAPPSYTISRLFLEVARYLHEQGCGFVKHFNQTGGRTATFRVSPLHLPRRLAHPCRQGAKQEPGGGCRPALDVATDVSPQLALAKCQCLVGSQPLLMFQKILEYDLVFCYTKLWTMN